MSYAEWLDDSRRGAWSDPDRARRWNLRAETRIALVLEDFRRCLGDAHARCCAAGGDRCAAALQALKEMIDQLDAVDSRWLGHLTLAPGTPVPAEMHTHVTAQALKRVVRGGRFDPNRPSPRVRLARGLKTDERGLPVRRFIWVTFAPDGGPLPEDPATVMRELGLAWYRADDYIYRITLTVDAGRLFVPTCLDAGLNEAWAPPPPGHPWGMTRHLETGELCRPELLVEVADHAGGRPVAELVAGRGGMPMPVGPVVLDYMCGRPDHGP